MKFDEQILIGLVNALMLVMGVIIVGYFLWTILKPSSENQWLVLAFLTFGIGMVGFMAFHGIKSRSEVTKQK